MYDDKDLQRIYDKKYFSTRSRPPMWQRRAEFIVDKFHPKTVLDIGCAYGELVKSLVKLGVDAYGIDGSDYAISHADPFIRDRLFKVNFNSTKFPFSDQKFDFIGGFYSIEHVHNFDFFANELYRIISDDGRVWFLTPDVGEKGRNEKDVYSNELEEWHKIFRKYNFNFEKFSPHEMMALKGKLGKFKFYKYPNPIQNSIKKIAYNYSNRKFPDASFLLTKNH